MSKADFASLKKLAMVDMGIVKHCGDDDIWRCRRMKWTIVLKATESFSNPDPCCQVNTIGQGGITQRNTVAKKYQLGCFHFFEF